MYLNNLSEIEDLLKGVNIINPGAFRPVTGVASISKASHSDLVFIDKSVKDKDKYKYIAETKARTVICDVKPENEADYSSKCLILTSDPKLLFIKVFNRINPEKHAPFCHPTVAIHPEAKIHPNTFIGAHTYIGKSEIGEGTVIRGNCHIYDHVHIGKRVKIDAGCIIGAPGFGFVRDENGIPHRFPQIGGVIIEDDVELGANDCIDSGALEPTVIGKGVKMDNLVHIAHNVTIGKYSYIIAGAMIAGSSTIGAYSWIAPSAAINNKITVGDRTLIGIGAVVQKDVPDGETWAGYPACPIREFARKQIKISQL